MDSSSSSGLPTIPPSLSHALLNHCSPTPLPAQPARLSSEVLRLLVLEVLKRASDQARLDHDLRRDPQGDSERHASDQNGSDQNTGDQREELALEPRHVLAVATQVIMDFS
ncbi:hypothetical protein TeGR_g14567 [Tetraparma gracilis]|uniref:Uncharacterized protein n=1 Tax=Tetraparma gracilis TaxID=2962635 RepID=A0ABQ6M4M4_9STRA|nr:hypothetical protein TeGR_g14567 [Tetraparma gracilis]